MDSQVTHILMVDDHPAILSGYESILKSFQEISSLKITIANSIKEAWTYCNIKNFIETVDIVFLDHSMPPYTDLNIQNGTELGKRIKRLNPNIKFVMLTSHEEPLLIRDMIQNLKPLGILNKSDITVQVLNEGYERVRSGMRFYSRTIVKALENTVDISTKLDKIDMKILYLLSQGVRNKNLSEHIPLTQDMIYKRKAKIKSLLDLSDANDEELLKKLRDMGAL